MSGESTRVLKVTGLKTVVSPSVEAGSSAVPKCQPAGSFTLGSMVMSREKHPAG